MSEYNLRSACENDAARIVTLVSPYVQTGLVLPRTLEDVRRRIENFIIAEKDGEVCGCVALRDFGQGLEEIRSLVVSSGHTGKGVGTLLIRKAMELAVSRDTQRLFALTMRPHLFERIGFEIVNKDLFPQKVWTDCAVCKKIDCCDEVAVQIYLSLGKN